VTGQRSFLASAHASREEAEVALEALEELGREKTLRLADAAIVVRTDEGRVELHQKHELAIGEGAVGGGVAGVLAGVAFGIPIVGPIAGLAIGVGLGAIDTGINDDRMRRLGADLEPGQAALCALVGEADWPAVRARMAPLAGELLVAELTLEAEEALREARETDPA
jgi:uncharacterized membrane protein